MNLKRIYIFLIIIGAVIVLTSVIDFLQGKVSMQFRLGVVLL